jgi:hypothetical protein
MLTRPGSVPGSGWMRSVSERLASGPAYAGNGVAYGYHEASGRQKEKLFG